MSFSFRIKICGITSEEVARAAVDAGADHLGLVFCASARRVTLERASLLVAEIPASWVGVFADAPLEEVAQAARKLDLASIQLHGRETPEECRIVRERTGVPVWKAISAAEATEDGYEAVVDALLLDAGPGGTGRALDWVMTGARFPRARRVVPLLLAGGLGPENVARAIHEAQPDGVDASSRLELVPGVKDPGLVRAFVHQARAAADAASENGMAGAAP
ncbi:MAG: phosphoribosylanthranilate isomerase [Gemmatimonadales bacterium]